MAILKGQVQIKRRLPSFHRDMLSKIQEDGELVPAESDGGESYDSYQFRKYRKVVAGYITNCVAENQLNSLEELAKLEVLIHLPTSPSSID